MRDQPPCNVDCALFSRTAARLGGLFAAASRVQRPHPQPPSATAPAPSRPPPPATAAATTRSGSDASSALGSHYTASVSASACHSASSSPGPADIQQRQLVAAALSFGRACAQSSYVVVRGCVHLLGVVNSLMPRGARVLNGGGSSSSPGMNGFGGGSSSIPSNSVAAPTDAATTTDASGDTCYFSLCSAGSGAAGDGSGSAGAVQPPAVSPLRVVHVEVGGLDELPSAEELRLTLMQHHHPHASRAGSLASELDAFPPAPAAASSVDRPPPYTILPPAISVGPRPSDTAPCDLPNDQGRENDVDTHLDTDSDVRADPQAADAGVEVEVLVWDGGGRGRVRVVAVGSCGAVLLDREVEVEVERGELGGGWHPNQGTPAGRIRCAVVEGRGGIFVGLHALHQSARAGAATALPVHWRASAQAAVVVLRYISQICAQGCADQCWW